MTYAQLRTKTRTSISRKSFFVKSGFQILYAVKQFSLLFSKAKLKQGAHILTKPMIHLPRACRKRTALWFPANSSHMCCVELALKGNRLGRKGFFQGFSGSLTDGYAMLMSPSKGKTAVHGSHCPLGMAVRIREVMARLWVGECVPLALIC